jgi:hypothetical protein
MGILGGYLPDINHKPGYYQISTICSQLAGGGNIDR